jgi:hypothetical protein
LSDQYLISVRTAHNPLREIDTGPGDVPMAIYVCYQIVNIRINPDANLEYSLFISGGSIVPLDRFDERQSDLDMDIIGVLNVQKDKANPVAGRQ